jgi:RAB protein geranylgeranyltransferase component A
VAGQAAGIETHYQTGRGAIMDLYENFYFNFNILHKLTASREEMKSSSELSIKIKEWMMRTVPKSSDMENYCRDGIELFEEYHKAMSDNGLLSLPSRGR